MAGPSNTTELIPVPRPTAAPAAVAIGLIFVVVGLWSFWPYSVIGAGIALGGLFRWLSLNRAEIARMPAEQHSFTTARRP